MRPRELLLVGFGRLGKLLVAMLRPDFRISVLEVRKACPLPRGISRATPSDIGRFDLIVMAIPIRRLEGFLRGQGGKIRPGAFVCDMSALKVLPLRWMKRYLPPSVSFAGLHPLFGPDSYRRDDKGLGVVLCRGRTSLACHRRLKRLIQKYRLKCIEMNPTTHDRTIASTLFLSQWVGKILPPAGLFKSLPFTTPMTPSLQALASRAHADRGHLLPDLCRFSPFSARMLERITSRGFALSESLRVVNEPPGD